MLIVEKIIGFSSKQVGEIMASNANSA